MALATAVEISFDIIFLDVMLPEMDGYQACKLMKAYPTCQTTPIVMLTSKNSPFSKLHGALVGCDNYLTKPVNAEVISRTLALYSIIDREIYAANNGSKA